MIWWCYTFSDFLTLWRTKASDECVACCDVYMIRDTGTVNTIHSIIPGVSFERPHQYFFLSYLLYQEAVIMTPKKVHFGGTRQCWQIALGFVNLTAVSFTANDQLCITVHYSPENPVDADSVSFQSSALWSSFSPVVIWVIYRDSLIVVVSTLEYEDLM